MGEGDEEVLGVPTQGGCVEQNQWGKHFGFGGRASHPPFIKGVITTGKGGIREDQFFSR